jgi:hypothetical protein
MRMPSPILSGPPIDTLMASILRPALFALTIRDWTRLVISGNVRRNESCAFVGISMRCKMVASNAPSTQAVLVPPMSRPMIECFFCTEAMIKVYHLAMHVFENDLRLFGEQIPAMIDARAPDFLGEFAKKRAFEVVVNSGWS